MTEARKFSDLDIYTTPLTLERTKGLFGYEIAYIKDGHAVLTFSTVRRAAGFVDLTIEPVTLIGEIKSFTQEVTVMVKLTPHHTDICDDCGGCTRNACESHRLCYC